MSVSIQRVLHLGYKISAEVKVEKCYIIHNTKPALNSFIQSSLA